MTEKEKQDILHKTKDWFRQVGESHIKNTAKLKKVEDFKYNPFLLSYLSYFHSGNCSPASLAKTLIFPRVLGTSINTTFGNAVEDFVIKVLSAFGSDTYGMDVEFIDVRDHRKKFVRMKASPITINSGDVEPIIQKFKDAYNLSRKNKTGARPEDYILGIMYGTHEELNGHYKAIENEYEILVGKDFWQALTGDENFYFDLIDVCAEVAQETNGTELLNRTIQELAKTKEIQELSKKLSERK